MVLEGVEGSGKTTQAGRLARRLEARGVAHTVVREPGGTEAGERIRRVVLDPELEVAPETELLLILAARAEFVRRRVEPALARGEVVLADRYELSTLAYQGIARGLGLERIRLLNRFATGGRRPDVTVVLLVDPEEGRRRAADLPADRLEREGASFHEEVARAYRRLVREEPGVVAVDGTGSPSEVEERILEELAARWPPVFGGNI